MLGAKVTCYIKVCGVEGPELVHPVAVDVDEEVPGQQHPNRQVEEDGVHQAEPVLYSLHPFFCNRT